MAPKWFDHWTTWAGLMMHLQLSVPVPMSMSWCAYLQIRIQMLTELPVQVDGEPWLQPPGQVVVLRSALKVNTGLMS